MRQSMRKTRPCPFWTGYTTQLIPAPTIGLRHCRLCQEHGLRNYRLLLLRRVSPQLSRRISPHLLCLTKRQRVFQIESRTRTVT
jgi:hypothetical protein